MERSTGRVEYDRRILVAFDRARAGFFVAQKNPPPMLRPPWGEGLATIGTLAFVFLMGYLVAVIAAPLDTGRIATTAARVLER